MKFRERVELLYCGVHQLSFHKQLYGESILQAKNNGANCIIESCEVLELQEQKMQVKQQPQPRDAEMEVVSRPLQVSLSTTAASASAADSNSSISPVRPSSSC